MRLTRRQTLALTALALPLLVRAQPSWPRQSIRFVVPFAPGGTSEIVARTVAYELTRQLGQTVYVDNKGGGAGIPAMVDVAKATPDGYTIILGHVGSLAVNPIIFPNQPYDVNKDFVPVTLLAKVPNLFVIHPDVPARNFSEFVAYVKSEPRQAQLRLGRQRQRRPPGDGVPQARDRHVHHPHSVPRHGPAADRPAGRPHAGLVGRTAGLAARTSRAASCAPLRSVRRSVCRRCPTCRRWPRWAHKGFETSQWYGILAPAGTPREIVKRLQEESLKALSSNAVTERFASDSAVGGGGPPEEFAAFIAQQQKVWGDIVRRAGIKPD